MKSRLISFVVALVVFAFGLTSFVPSAFGCGTGQGGASCKDAVSTFDWLSRLQVVVDAATMLLP